ncbi:hypothetical protein N5W20_03690 [Candidatus Kirkpatrickella diaphorinae]|uniref:Pertussis toxin subunit 1 n=1 Tax=Candidatus Kirkpatrickella diaphorinae TaxID=2984322 RepID=A0ABY6GKX0_9PROT|nr:hypothetical protein [Candidatus Kirkpatrickella diaphorinae]UYH51969.1 hypothetical protein N5W20_03690 [Candidatus Kirkpatrickella diaphorinae]
MTMRYAAIFSGLTVVSLNLANIAQATPERVYRFTFVAPETIFVRGFIAPGFDRSFLRHASGNSVYSWDTIYVSTSDSIHESRRMLRISLLRHPDMPHYLYVIRPTTDFYDMPRSLMNAVQCYQDANSRRRARALWYRFHLQREWSALGGVAPELIQGAYRAQIINGGLVLSDWTPNPHYVEAAAEVNLDPMPLDDEAPSVGWVETGNQQGEFMSLSFSIGCENMWLRASSETHCASADRVSLDDPVPDIAKEETSREFPTTSHARKPGKSAGNKGRSRVSPCLQNDLTMK